MSLERLQLGAYLPTWDDENHQTTRWAEMRDIVRLIDQSGFDNLWVADHLLRDWPDGSTFGFWECWTVLSAAAAITSRVTVGPFVACAGYHNPAHLAKSVETLDEVSGGRAILALGAGVPDYDRSWQAFGFPSDHPAGRFEESLEIVTRLLKGERLTYKGTYHSTEQCEIAPWGPRRGGIPVWAAAGGPRMLKATARWADVLSFYGYVTTPRDVASVREKLSEACAQVGRDPGSIGLTGLAFVSFSPPDDNTGVRAKAIKGSPEEMARQLHALHLAGMSHLTLFIDHGEGSLKTPYPVATAKILERFEPVIQALRAIEGESHPGTHRPIVA